MRNEEEDEEEEEVGEEARARDTPLKERGTAAYAFGSHSPPASATLATRASSLKGWCSRSSGLPLLYESGGREKKDQEGGTADPGVRVAAPASNVPGAAAPVTRLEREEELAEEDDDAAAPRVRFPRPSASSAGAAATAAEEPPDDEEEEGEGEGAGPLTSAPHDPAGGVTPAELGTTRYRIPISTSASWTGPDAALAETTSTA